MTVDCTNIESVLGPLRNFERFAYPTLSLASPSWHTNLSSVAWTSTSDPPVADWIGFDEVSSSHEDTLRRMRVTAFIAFMDWVPVLADGHKWCLLDHQAGGHSCRHIRFVGMLIALKQEVESKFLAIAKSWYNSQLGWDIPSLTELFKYRSQLQEIGLDCNSSGTFTYLTEGFYPVDLNQSVIDRVCQNPFRLENVLDSSRSPGKLEMHKGILVFIAPNSD